MKIGLGVATIAISVIAGIAIKNKAAAQKAIKALEKRADGLGLAPEVLKTLETKHFKIEKCGKLHFKAVDRSIKFDWINSYNDYKRKFGIISVM